MLLKLNMAGNEVKRYIKLVSLRRQVETVGGRKETGVGAMGQSQAMDTMDDFAAFQGQPIHPLLLLATFSFCFRVVKGEKRQRRPSIS